MRAGHALESSDPRYRESLECDQALGDVFEHIAQGCGYFLSIDCITDATRVLADLVDTWYAPDYVQLVGFPELLQILLSLQDALLRSPLPTLLGTILCSTTHYKEASHELRRQDAHVPRLRNRVRVYRR